MRYFITGASGFVGSHLAEACVKRGDSVSTLARPQSDVAMLEKLGVAIHRGDLTESATIPPALAGADVVVHCAAKVGDWGPVEEYRRVNVEGLRNLLEACRTQKLARVVHLSSLGVYPARNHYGTDENAPLPPSHIDGYTQTKVEAEQLALDYQRQHRLPVVVLRPGFIYGPRDRAVLPRLIDSLRSRHFRYLGSGKRAMNCIYVGNLVEAIFLAVERPEAVGQIFNLTDGETISKRRFIESIVSGLSLPKPPPLSVPVWLARILAWGMERRAAAAAPPSRRC